MELQYKTILSDLAATTAQLVAVSKRQPLDKIRSLYALGHRAFGENRVQEFLEKKTQLAADIQWHLIGHLQTNKVKSIIWQTTLIHSVDRLRLARRIHEESAAEGVTTSVLLQIKIAQEESKFGYLFSDLIEDFIQGRFAELTHIEIKGVMGMASFVDDKSQIETEFTQLQSYYSELKERFFSKQSSFSELSMGMSGDYHLALKHGATLVRVGSKIFGSRN